MKERFGESAGDSYINVTKKKEQALKECEKQFNRVMSDKEPSYTYWTTIAYNDDNEFAVVMCYLDKESAESYGYDGEADFVQAKFAYRPNKSVMGEYEWDWLMPYPINEYGDTLDTDMPIGSPSDFSWILDEAYSFIDKFNADLPADDDWDDFDDEDSDLYEAKETDGTVKFYYKGNLVGTCDADYIDCDAVYELMKKDKTASTAVLNYMNSLGDPVFPVSDEDWSTAETNVDNVDIEDLYYWFMKELGYEADEYDEGLYTEFDGWEIFADEEENDLYEGCGSKKKKKKVLNQKKVCGERKPAKTVEVYIIQGNYGYGWEDESEYDDWSQAKADIKEYRASSAGNNGASYRLITRRVPNPDYKAESKVCGEDRMYDLAPQKRDSRKSFYGKAKVVDKGNGEYELISYNTPVACVKDGKVVYADLHKYSQTTDRHIREFLAQFADDLTEGCHGGKKKSKKKVLNQKKVCGEDAKRTKNGYTFFVDDNAEPEVVRKGLVDYTLDGYVDMGDFDAPCKVGFYDGEDEPVYIFVDGGVTDDGYHYEKDTIALESYVREERMYDLAPQKRDSRKSFYGKAKIVDKGNGEYELISYNTPVACVKDGKVVYADLRKYSATTDRHIREFLAQFCDEC